MRILPFTLSTVTTVALILILNTKLVLPAPLGKLLSPQHGVWQNAEKTNENFTTELKFPQLSGKVEVYLDDRLVPHVFAEHENDVYFVQGYLHAKFRLWQMELQTHAAAGRLAEIVGGEKAFQHDREFRRLGMVSAAENSLKEMEKDPVIKAECDAYTAGVNAFIEKLTESSLPIEYKLIGYYPEKWTNLKSVLFTKYISYDLASYDEDFEMTNAKNYFSPEDFALIYPIRQDSLDPIIPKGTKYEKPGIVPLPPANVDSLYFNSKTTVNINENKPDKDNGSNNWAVSGVKTKSGAPILCNDPHLGLNLPSLWYEMQLSTPDFNAYGVTFPGAPGVIIGYNDSCAFGFTNGGRDVRDYYEIKFKDDSHKEYWYNSQWVQTKFRIDTIQIKDTEPFIDSVAYTIWGPVMYDNHFGSEKNKTGKCYAVRWKAHDPSNELAIFNGLDRAKNYNDYLAAVANMHAPGQNCVFACKNGDIALRTQGEWPAKWKGQGDFLMPGWDSSYAWQGMIPPNETPFQYNPERGFVSSANQKPADSTYPYYLGRRYSMYRGIIINRLLNSMSNVTPQDMMALQTNNYNVFAEMARPILLKNVNESLLTSSEKKYFDILKSWNLRNDVGSKGATVFDQIWKKFESEVWDDEFEEAPEPIIRPFESTLLEAVLRDTAFKFIDKKKTSQKETLSEVVTSAVKKAAIELSKIESAGKLDWEKFKATHIDHLARVLTPFNRMDLPIGGGRHIINATRDNHGPSWRMVVSLTTPTEAYGVYPGGQSGNPGSKFYDTFVDQWAAGKYYSLWLMNKNEIKDPRIKWKMIFSN